MAPLATVLSHLIRQDVVQLCCGDQDRRSHCLTLDLSYQNATTLQNFNKKGRGIKVGELDLLRKSI